jgi:iron(III) transport system permease protein
LGYLIPSAILAVGIISISIALDALFGLHFPNLLTGSILFLIIAFIIKFISIALDPLQAAGLQKGKNLRESALSLGSSSFKVFRKVTLPIYKPVLFATFILVFIDVLKELPLTLLLRPFNFETLSTSVFQYAKINESVPQAAPAALIIVLLGVIPVSLLHRYIQNGKRT